MLIVKTLEKTLFKSDNLKSCSFKCLNEKKI